MDNCNYFNLNLYGFLIANIRCGNLYHIVHLQHLSFKNVLCCITCICWFSFYQIIVLWMNERLNDNKRIAWNRKMTVNTMYRYCFIIIPSCLLRCVYMVFCDIVCTFTPNHARPLTLKRCCSLHTFHTSLELSRWSSLDNCVVGNRPQNGNWSNDPMHASLRDNVPIIRAQYRENHPMTLCMRVCGITFQRFGRNTGKTTQ